MAEDWERSKGGERNRGREGDRQRDRQTPGRPCMSSGPT